jgi:hypothetical protein
MVLDHWKKAGDLKALAVVIFLFSITFAGPYLSRHRHDNGNIDMGSLFTTQ